MRLLDTVGPGELKDRVRNLLTSLDILEAMEHADETNPEASDGVRADESDLD